MYQRQVPVGVAVGADPGAAGEVRSPLAVSSPRPSAPPLGVQDAVVVGAVGERMVLVFEQVRLLDASSVLASGLLGAGLRGGDAVDREQPAVAEQRLVVDAAEGGVVDDAQRAGSRGASRSMHSSAMSASPPGVGTQSTSRIMRAWTSSVRAATMTYLVPQAVSPLPSTCSAGVGLEAQRTDFAGRLVDAGVAGLGLEQRGDDLAVGVEHPVEVGVGARAGPVRVERPRLDGLAGGESSMDVRGAVRGLGRSGGGAAVEVVVAAHRLGRAAIGTCRGGIVRGRPGA